MQGDVWQMSGLICYLNVKKRGIAAGPGKELAPNGLGAAFDQFRAVLTDLLAFTAANRLRFEKDFSLALKVLESQDISGIKGLSEYAPAGVMSTPAMALLGASRTASVFGGMGSWNDLCFEGETKSQYESLSRRLMDAMSAAFMAAINETRA